MNKHKLIRKFRNQIFGKFPQFSYSRSGEDLIIEEIIGVHKYNGFYVDVGAYHPIEYSNTYKFHLKGWNGINIDASVEVINNFNKIRPNDKNINVAIGEGNEELKYYMFNEDPSMNTSSEEFMVKIMKENSFTLKETRLVPVKTLGSVLKEHLRTDQEIDLMSIDVEGLDFEVIKTNDWTLFRPKVLIVETSAALEDIQSLDMTVYMRNLGYKQVAYSLVTMKAGNVYFIDTRVQL
jgi:FkbM family methyltransferase